MNTLGELYGAVVRIIRVYEAAGETDQDTGESGRGTASHGSVGSRKRRRCRREYDEGGYQNPT